MSNTRIRKTLSFTGLLSLSIFVLAIGSNSARSHPEGEHHPASSPYQSQTDSQSETPAKIEIEPFILLPSYQCVWRRVDSSIAGGGRTALCKKGELPFASGITGIKVASNCPLSILSPVRSGDGLMNGERLAEIHPDVHGEPIETHDKDPDDLHLRKDVGTSKHLAHTHPAAKGCGDTDLQAVITLCCSRDFPFDIHELHPSEREE